MGKIAPEDAKLIAEFVARKGVTVIERGVARRGSIENCDWMKGKKWSPMQRYKRAEGYARANGLSAPVWTDHKEAELLRLRAEGVPYQEISKLLGVSASAAKTRYRYIRLGRRNKRDVEHIKNDDVSIGRNDVRIAFVAPTTLALPAPLKRSVRSALVTPPIIYLPGPTEPAPLPALRPKRVAAEADYRPLKPMSGDHQEWRWRHGGRVKVGDIVGIYGLMIIACGKVVAINQERREAEVDWDDSQWWSVRAAPTVDVRDLARAPYPGVVRRSKFARQS